jgi:hypothetical protein
MEQAVLVFAQNQVNNLTITGAGPTAGNNMLLGGVSLTSLYGSSRNVLLNGDFKTSDQPGKIYGWGYARVALAKGSDFNMPSLQQQVVKFGSGGTLRQLLYYDQAFCLVPIA